MSPVTIDPENNEPRLIRRYAPLEGKRVLDIGCGDGRLTCLYAPHAEQVIGVDPNTSRLNTAINSLPAELTDTVLYAAAHAEALPLPKEIFDTAIFTTSL